MFVTMEAHVSMTLASVHNTHSESTVNMSRVSSHIA